MKSLETIRSGKRLPLLDKFYSKYFGGQDDHDKLDEAFRHERLRVRQRANTPWPAEGDPA